MMMFDNPVAHFLLASALAFERYLRKARSRQSVRRTYQPLTDRQALNVTCARLALPETTRGTEAAHHYAGGMPITLD